MPVATNQDIDIAVIACPIAGEGAEQNEIGNAEALREGFVCAPSRARTSSLVTGNSSAVVSRRLQVLAADAVNQFLRSGPAARWNAW